MAAHDVEPEPLVDALVQSAFTTMAVLTRVSAEHDLSLTQLRVLGILRDRRLRMAGLAGFLGLEKSTMSGLVERAERRGLLERTPSADDRRAVDVALTTAGAELAERVHSEVTKALAPTLDSLASAEQARLAVLLRRMLS
jgi:DNA-binding MarR family transcriptional regulator